jgi:hypothetical protein
MHIASKLKIDFNIHTLSFAEKYPKEELEDVMKEEEFQAVLQKINEELAAELHHNSKALKKWFDITKVLLFFVVGIALLPVVLHKSTKQAKLLTEFQDATRDYLYKINKKKFLKRKIEWKLVKDKKRARGKDAVNPESQIRLEIIYESSTSKELTEQFRDAQNPLGMEPWNFTSATENDSRHGASVSSRKPKVQETSEHEEGEPLLDHNAIKKGEMESSREITMARS